MKLHLFIFAFILLLSCEKDDSVEIINDSWKLFDKIQYQAKNASNCFVQDELMIIRSLNSLSYIDKNNELLNQYVLISNPAYGYRYFPTNSGYLITIGGGIYPTQVDFQPFSNLSDIASFSFHNDSTIEGLEILNGSLNEPAFISSPQGLFLFKIKESRSQLNSSLVIADVEKPDVYKILPLNSKPNYTSLHFYYSGKFYLSSTDIDFGLFTIDSLGSIEKISDQSFGTVIESNGIFYAVGSSYELLISNDNGYTWKESSQKAPSVQIINLDTRTYFLVQDEIIEVTIIDDKIEFIKYNSKGLDGNSITTLCHFNGRFYCTTKSGVFYIEEEYFKPEE